MWDIITHTWLPNNLPLKCESPTSLAWSTLGSRLCGVQVSYGPGRLAHCRSRGSPDSQQWYQSLGRLGGEREGEWDPSVDQASDVGDSHLRGRLLGNQVWVVMSHIYYEWRKQGYIREGTHKPIGLRFWARVWCSSLLWSWTLSPLPLPGLPRLTTGNQWPYLKNLFFISLKACFTWTLLFNLENDLW